MQDSTCRGADCERADVLARGLCRRCYMRAKRAGTLDQFAAADRVCRHCGETFKTGKNGKHAYCSFTCQRSAVATRREAQRKAELTRPCAVCGEAISHTQRSDAKHCSTTCQQSTWYQANDEILKARASVWKMTNRDMAKDSDHRRRAAMRGNAVGPIDYAEVWRRDNGHCWICLEPVDPELTYPHKMYRSWDHIIPIIKGGAHAMHNIALSHLVCNTSKKSKILDRLPAWAS